VTRHSPECFNRARGRIRAPSSPDRIVRRVPAGRPKAAGETRRKLTCAILPRNQK
jgi:hypothetical protein